MINCDRYYGSSSIYNLPLSLNQIKLSNDLSGRNISIYQTVQLSVVQKYPPGVSNCIPSLFIIYENPLCTTLLMNLPSSLIGRSQEEWWHHLLPAFSCCQPTVYLQLLMTQTILQSLFQFDGAGYHTLLRVGGLWDLPQNWHSDSHILPQFIHTVYHYHLCNAIS